MAPELSFRRRPESIVVNASSILGGWQLAIMDPGLR